MIDEVETKQEQFEDFNLWVCPKCGRTVKHDIPSTFMPNTSCWHGEEFSIPHQMELVWTKKGKVK